MKSTVSLQGKLAEREFQQLPLVLQLLKKHNCCSCRNLQSAGNKCKLRNTLENMLINDYQSFSSITSLFFFKDFFRFFVLDGKTHESWKCINRAGLTDVYMYIYCIQNTWDIQPARSASAPIQSKTQFYINSFVLRQQQNKLCVFCMAIHKGAITVV